MKIDIKELFKHVNYENDFINRLENEIECMIDTLYKPHNLQYTHRVYITSADDKYHINIKIDYVTGDLVKNKPNKILNLAQNKIPFLGESLKLDEPLQEMYGGDIKTVNIDLSTNEIDNMDIESDSKEINTLNDHENEDNQEIVDEHNESDSDDGGENKFCEKCGDEFRTYSSKNICVECREINSQEIDDIEIS